ncbi:MAG TPA: LTA synthase family protein [Ferruginibacter sp.]|nr:LTA synthase family protein [Ferruginibacter sp.]HMP19404.1 LTA synthase family protein [Ferruginibacter sp.]
MLYDVMVVLSLNMPYVLLLYIFYKLRFKTVAAVAVSIPFALLNLLCILLSLADIFYFRFRQQRADADMLFSATHSLGKAFMASPVISACCVLLLVIVSVWLWYSYKKVISGYNNTNAYPASALLLPVLGVLFFLTPYAHRIILPAYPLLSINSNSLPFVQNSFHTLLYSLYRKEQGAVPPLQYMSTAAAAARYKYEKKITALYPGTTSKNIVLFIMESVPEDFFNSKSRYKVNMPFLDSLVSNSTYYSQAYSYAFTSTNGLVAILVGMPTLTDIPLYHSRYLGLKRTAIGDALRKKGYQSAFFIGDSYDDFGFAKCCNWLGIDKYYSKEKVPGYKKLEAHTMGLHDGDMLPFVADEVSKMNAPFFAVHYNISTHYPHNLPAGYRLPARCEAYTPAMKAMRYYNDCLQDFFAQASKQAWYSNTLFVFCADHWAFPDDAFQSPPAGQEYHIPVFIFDPANHSGKTISSTVSQFDILGTVLSIAGVEDSITSFGNSLYHTAGTPVVCKKDADNYVVIDSAYVLGYNKATGKAGYCYHFLNDPERKNNLVNTVAAKGKISELIITVQAFLQNASQHYNQLAYP